MNCNYNLCFLPLLSGVYKITNRGAVSHQVEENWSRRTGRYFFLKKVPLKYTLDLTPSKICPRFTGQPHTGVVPDFRNTTAHVELPFLFNICPRIDSKKLTFTKLCLWGTRIYPTVSSPRLWGKSAKPFESFWKNIEIHEVAYLIACTLKEK